MKSHELRGHSQEELIGLEKKIICSLVQARFKNSMGQLEDTSQLRKSRKDLARVKTILKEREKSSLPLNEQLKGEAKW
ncbi:50S ribosomal protein L29 [Pajaroellobacter abortibovis]|uniref:Large ribosomal subunit protein uL29 n=1 Tax=Pajaroellobacter abortibovis TaxID=1882918 RepID=A0A1L6MXV4_9BACT|nr:50S ribosomal protein L29 [Pajaroellobacter abortibovis]APS00423.1 50S ribosomal protein L29 [Pajaroellobacter abortibovis]